MRIALPLTAFLLCGCIVPGELTPYTRLTGIRLVGVEAVAERDAPDRDIRIRAGQRLLKVSIASETDLVQFAAARDLAVNAEIRPCAASEARRASYPVDPHVYGNLGYVSSARVWAARRQEKNEEHLFHFYMAAARGGQGDPSPYVYDLILAPEEMCVSFQGGSTNLMGDLIFPFGSETLRLSKESIRAALGR